MISDKEINIIEGIFNSIVNYGKLVKQNKQSLNGDYYVLDNGKLFLIYYEQDETVFLSTKIYDMFSHIISDDNYTEGVLINLVTELLNKNVVKLLN